MKPTPQINTITGGPITESLRTRTPYERRILVRRRSLQMGMVLLALVLLGLLISWIHLPYGINEVNAGKLQAPSMKHLFGTDHLGRDIFTRVLAGTQDTLRVALGTVAIGLVGGTILGALGGYWGGAIDWIITRFTETFMAFPGILLAMVFAAAFGPGVWQLMLSLGIAFIPSFSRVVRSGFLMYRDRDFIKRLRILGMPWPQIILTEILPLLRPQLVTACGVGFANAILAEASMSYIGLGLQHPTPSWGRMLYEAQGYIRQAPWYVIFPGLALFASVLGFYLLNQGLNAYFTRKGEYSI